MTIKLPDAPVVWEEYAALGSVHRVAALYGCSGERVRKLLTVNGYRLDHIKWSPEEDLALIHHFDDALPAAFSPRSLAHTLMRSINSVMERARKLGVTESLSHRSKTNTHKASQYRATLELAKSREGEMEVHPEQVDQPVTKSGKGNKWHADWYDVGLETRLYLRSKWEYHWCLYLNWLKANGKILRWEYEPQTFIFNEVQHGTRAYIPDFKVYTSDTEYHWEEVKGWMDSASKTKLRRMAKYYPEEKLVLIDETAYRQIEAQYAHLIPGWGI